MPSHGLDLNHTLIRTKRENAGLTVEGFAQLVGISRQFASMIELGQRRPSPPVAKAIADVLGIPLKELRNGTNHKR